MRTLTVDGARESSCYTDPGRHSELIYEYLKIFAAVPERMETTAPRVLLFGGAGFSFPKYFISRYRHGTMDVVELHRELYDLAREYFFLDELSRDFDLPKSGRLRVYIQDANKYIETCRNRYDIIYNDAYHGATADGGLLSEKSSARIASLLEKDGSYVINLITPVEGYGSMQAVLACQVLKNHFRSVRFYQVNPKLSKTTRQNCIITATGPIS